MGNLYVRGKMRYIDNPQREYLGDPFSVARKLDRPNAEMVPSDAIDRIPKKRGRKPVAHDLANYWCPKHKGGPCEKSKYKNVCRECYNAEYNARAKKWYAENKSKGYGKRGRPTGPPPTPPEFCPVSTNWLSRPITPSRADPN